MGARGRGRRERSSAVPASEHTEERLDVRVGRRVAVAVEVGRAARPAAVPGHTREERFDVRVGGRVTVVVEVGAAARGRVRHSRDEKGAGLAADRSVAGDGRAVGGDTGGGAEGPAREVRPAPGEVRGEVYLAGWRGPEEGAVPAR